LIIIPAWLHNVVYATSVSSADIMNAVTTLCSLKPASAGRLWRTIYHLSHV